MQERNLKDIYNQYLLSKNEQHTAVRYKDKSWYHSSAAGLCARKHFFSSVSQVEGTPVDEKTQRIFRLGNLVHEDIQDALTWYSQIHGLPLLIEKEIYFKYIPSKPKIKKIFKNKNRNIYIDNFFIYFLKVLIITFIENFNHSGCIKKINNIFTVV